ncbi:MAG: tetratricopeptide repeat protein [Spirulinaceae cyanobacterium]
MKSPYWLTFPSIVVLSLFAGNLINQPLLAASEVEVAQATTAEDFYSEGNQFASQGRYEKAIEFYDKALDIRVREVRKLDLISDRDAQKIVSFAYFCLGNR